MSAATQSIETNCANCAAAGDLHGGTTLAWISENGWTLLSAKNWESRIDASHSRQPLVKGERLVRYEVNAVMQMLATRNTSSINILT